MFQRIRASQRVWIAYWIGIVVALLIALITIMEERTEREDLHARAELRHWKRVAIEHVAEEVNQPAAEKGKSDGAPTE